MKRRVKNTQTFSGYSLVEIIVTIAVLGILTGIAASVYSGIVDKAEDRIALTKTEALNEALNDYEQLNWRVKLDPVADSISDEMKVVESLQYRNPVNPAPGSPYIRPDWRPVASSDIKDHRIRWQGRHFSLLKPGESGTGLKVDFESGDTAGSNKIFDADFQPLGLAVDEDDGDGG